MPTPRVSIPRPLCFLCFTGIRYGGLQRLKHKDVIPDTIRIFAQNTNSYIEIPHNDCARTILERYEGEISDNNPALTLMAEQRLNRIFKSVAQQADIDSLVTHLYYSGRAHQRDLPEVYPSQLAYRAPYLRCYHPHTGDLHRGHPQVH